MSETTKRDFSELLSSERIGHNKSEGRKKIDAFASDRSRILYCAAFRRLQQKAQVFSMETNACVRSRLTHSLEVADLGRRLANDIAAKLNSQGKLTDANVAVLVSVVENACLLHDIGNPPFGHFGEAAIQDWAKHEALALAPKQLVEENENGRKWKPAMEKLMKDFEEFDGNPQGFRIVTKLYSDFGPHGLDLTCATLLCGLKYARTSGEPSKIGDEEPGILKKAGWFRTEDDQVRQLHQMVDRPLGGRFPLTYIMEAADDISYCMSDIADGIEKGILTEGDFVRVFIEEWDKTWNPTYRDEAKTNKRAKRTVDLPEKIKYYSENPEKMVSFNHDFAVSWASRATRAAVEAFFDEKNEEAIWNGSAEPLMKRDCEMQKVLDNISSVCCKLLYPSEEAESIELTGYAVITGILRNYRRLLTLSREDFKKVMDGKRKKFPVETRMYNRIGKHCVKAYEHAVAALDEKDADFAQKEWWLRVHLLVDHISSMTDAYALETYQMLEGIALMRT